MTFKFSERSRGIRDIYAPAGSINAVLLALPQQREHIHDLVGVVLSLPRTGLTVVPTRQQGESYAALVLHGDSTYPRGSEISVSALELQTAIEVPIFRLHKAKR